MTDPKTSANGFHFVFPAIRGIQAGREYFVAMCPLHLIPKIFLYDEESAALPASFRAQRTLNSARIPEMADYILKHAEDYVFSSLTASVNGHIAFDKVGPQDENVGRIRIPMTAQFILNDGQHRRAAIEAALNQNSALANETISVVFYPDEGLERSQQMFSDLNRHAMKSTKSLTILYDRHDPLSRLACKVAETVPAFKGLVEQEKTTIPNRSVKLFTLSSIYGGTSLLLEKSKRDAVSPADEAFAIEFWKAVSENIPDWERAQRKEVSTSELRQNYIHAHGVAIQALGDVGCAARKQLGKNWRAPLTKLKMIDWDRSNAANWEGRATIGGHLSKTGANVKLTAMFIREQIGLKSSDQDGAVAETKGPIQGEAVMAR